MSVHKPLYPHRVMRRLQVLLREVEWLLLEVGWWLRWRLQHMLVRVLVLVLLVLLLVLLRLLLLMGHVHNGRGMPWATLQHFSAGQVRLAWMLWMRRKRGCTDGSTMQVVAAKVTAVVLVLGLGLLLVLHGPVSVPSRSPPSRGRAAARSGTGD